MVRALQEEATAWLATLGTDQWQSLHRGRHGTGRTLAEAIERGEVYLAWDGEQAVGTLTLDDYADPEFWRPADHPDQALYVHRMVVSRAARGNDIGGQMITWALERAEDRGKIWLRLDAWRTNHQLHRYYLQHGFDHVRTIDLPHRGSGALFQQTVPHRRRQVA